MSSCLTGGGRAYKLDLEIITSPSNSWTSHSSSPSSTLSESSNSPALVSTRKPRTPRKRPNQTYNEAAALLSTAYPKIFPTKHLTKPCKFTKPHYPFSYEPSDLIIPFQILDNSGLLLHPPLLEKPNFSIEHKSMICYEKPCQSPGEIDSKGCSSLEICDDFQEDFDAESILDEEIEEGIIDSIMGKQTTNNNNNDHQSMKENNFSHSNHQNHQFGTCYGFPIGLGFGNDFQYDLGMRNKVRPLRNVDDGEYWRHPSVNVLDITPKFSKHTTEKKKKKVEKLVDSRNSEPSAKDSSISNKPNNENSVQESAKDESNIPKSEPGRLILKLNYDNILNAWSDKTSPFSDEASGSEVAGNDVQARLAQIDLFSESGGVRVARVMRYKEKRRTRLFSKKIRYQVRKVNADRRPRMKGRFVRSPNSPENELG